MARLSWMMFAISAFLAFLAVAAGPVLAAGESFDAPEAIAQEPRVDAGHFVNIATARLWRFRLQGVEPGQAYWYTIVGQGSDPITGRGQADTLPHEHAVDLRLFRKGWINVRVDLLDAAGEPADSVTDSVYWDAAYPAGYL